MSQNPRTFEGRKRDHIRIALDPRTQAVGQSGLDQIELVHEALPDIDFQDVSLKTQSLGTEFRAPLFVSSMTAGHSDSLKINTLLAKACESRGWLMGVGSQRKELTDGEAGFEWQEVRKICPEVKLAGNIGIAQVITADHRAIEDLVESLGASCLFVHTNPLQECLQPEGTPQFKGGLKALEKLCAALSKPVILKEVGSGFSPNTLKRLIGIGLSAVDVSGKGGTHWGRVEGYRSDEGSLHHLAALSFADWGVGTVQSLQEAHSLSGLDYELWASGGVRSGLDAAKLIAMGAKMVGAAKPFLEGAMAGAVALDQMMEQFEFELRIALFSSGCVSVDELRESELWRQRRI